MELHPGGLLFFAIILLVAIIVAVLLLAWLLIVLKVIKRIDWAVMLILITGLFIGIVWKILT